ncbi:MAG TPA: hypothetical protein DEP99_02860 [Nitrospiraceae bacterium]|nr:hypothetical protein [Nitrospiraceae bacterium]
MEYKSIKQWPEDERPRERLLKFGSEGLSTAQLLAILLRTGGEGKSALELAMDLLMHFGSLKNIKDASPAEFLNVKGIGHAKIAQIKAAMELGKRLMSDAENSPERPLFKNSRDVYNYYRPKLYDLKREKFLCCLLDVKNRLFKETIISEGTLTSSLVHPREGFREAIKEAAASVIFVHNHPSGDPSPSREDLAITRRLVETGKIIGIEVLDHIILGDKGHTSIMEQGLL